MDWSTEEWDKAEMAEWRRSYKDLSPALQMFVASLIWLYHGQATNKWLERLPHKWHVADALPALKSAGLIGDWAKLVVTYQGW